MASPKLFINTSELHKLGLFIPELVPMIEKEVEKAMQESGMIVTTMVASRIAAHSKNTGNLEAAVSYPGGFNIDGDALGTYTGTIAAAQKVGMFGASAAMYSNYVEFGIPAGHCFPPVEPLEYWLIRKYHISEDVSHERAKRLCWSIFKRGIKAKLNFEKAWKMDGAGKKVERVWRKIPAKVVRAWDTGRRGK
jgi:hypothetical protein